MQPIKTLTSGAYGEMVACLFFVDLAAGHTEWGQSPYVHLSHQAVFAAGPLRQHLLVWMVRVEHGP